MNEIGSLLIIYGIPASGKSFFVNKIEKSLTDNFEKTFFFDIDDLEYYLREFDYDENLSENLKFNFLNLMKIQNKISFHDILSLINKNYEAIISNNKYYASSYDKNIWIYSRAMAYELIEFLLKQKILIVCEDTFLLSSMRKKFKSLCQRINCGFCDVFIECSLEKALKNNGKRKGNRKVSNEVIEKALSKIEISKKSVIYQDFPNTEFFSFEDITNKLKTPMLKIDDCKCLEEKQVERKKQEDNILFNFDLDFRKIIRILNDPIIFKSIPENKKKEEDKMELFYFISKLDDNSVVKLERISSKIIEKNSFCNKLLSSIKSDALKTARSVIKSQIMAESKNTSFENNIYLLLKYNLSIDLDQLIDLIDQIPLNRKNDINIFKQISLDFISKSLPLSSEFSADSLRRRLKSLVSCALTIYRRNALYVSDSELIDYTEENEEKIDDEALLENEILITQLKNLKKIYQDKKKKIAEKIFSEVFQDFLKRKLVELKTIEDSIIIFEEKKMKKDIFMNKLKDHELSRKDEEEKQLKGETIFFEEKISQFSKDLERFLDKQQELMIAFQKDEINNFI